MRLYDSLSEKLFNFNVLELELDGEVPEEDDSISIPLIQIKRKLTVWDIERILTHVASKESIKILVVKIKDLQIGLARAETIRRKILEVRNSGIKVYAYLEGSGNIEYLIASAAQKIIIPPWSVLNIIGLKAEVVFLKDALKKIDVEQHFKSVGEYKSAVETFTLNKMSRPHREMLTSLLDDLFKQLCISISQGRGIKLDKLTDLVDEAPFLPDESINNNLVDAVGYEACISEEIENSFDHKVKRVDADKYLKILRIKDRIRSLFSIFNRHSAIIALITDTGMITSGESKGKGRAKNIGHSTTLKTLREIYKNDKIKAVVYRISSPGGSGVSSDLICKELEVLSTKIPVIVSMSDVAASGGYLIPLGASKIVADPFTITGSIGVFGGKFNIKNLFSKFGINIESISKGKHSLMYSPTKGFTETEDKKISDMMKSLYDKFVKRVSDARKLSLKDAEKCAKGRVWTGNQAKNLKLVDGFGGIMDSIKLAAKEADLDEKNLIVRTIKKPNLLDLSVLGKSFGFSSIFDDYLDKIINLSREDVKALMPFIINIK